MPRMLSRARTSTNAAASPDVTPVGAELKERIHVHRQAGVDGQGQEAVGAPLGCTL
jgi:hypothetical protein